MLIRELLFVNSKSQGFNSCIAIFKTWVYRTVIYELEIDLFFGDFGHFKFGFHIISI